MAEKPKEKNVMAAPSASTPSSASSSSALPVFASPLLSPLGFAEAGGVRKRERDGPEDLSGQPEAKRRKKSQISQRSIVKYFAKNGNKIAASRLEKHKKKKATTPEMVAEFDQILSNIAEVEVIDSKKYFVLKQSSSPSS